jgi:hypothetical protein
MLAPPSSARRAVLPNLAAEPSASNTTERLPGNSEQLQVKGKNINDFYFISVQN